MKAIQFTIDEELLRRIDRLPEVRKHGRSAFLRRAAEESLRRRRQRDIREAYRRGYGAQPVTDEELGLPPDARAWPDE